MAEAAFANEETAATFPTELKDLIRVWYYQWFQTATGVLECVPHGKRGTTVCYSHV